MAKGNRGNPNPSPATRFGAGEKANPQGMTSAQRQAIIRASEIASQLRLKMLEQALGEVEGSEEAPATKQPLDLLNSDLAGLMKEADNRALGLPRAATEISGPDGGPIQTENAGKTKLEAFLGAIAGRASGSASE